MAHEWHDLTSIIGGRHFVVERVRLDSGVAIEGQFEVPSVLTLSADDHVFLAAFVRCHGSIKQMEKYFGVSYPTIKGRLSRLAEKLEFVRIDQDATSNEETLDLLERGEISVEEAINQLKKKER